MLNIFIFFIFVTTHVSDSIKVNMEGSITLGRDVVDVVNSILGKRLSGRRMFDYNEDKLSIIIETAHLCYNLTMCENNLGEFVNEYFNVLIKSIENIFEDLVGKSNPATRRKAIIEPQIQNIIIDVNKTLNKINGLMSNKSKHFYWIEVIKKINAICQKRAIEFAKDRIEGNATEIAELLNKIHEKLTISSTDIELQYEFELCHKHDICVKRYDCTKSLDEMLELLCDLEEEKINLFIRNFVRALDASNFYSNLNEVTTTEFQNILDEISYSQNISARNLFGIIRDIVKDRIKTIKDNVNSLVNSTDIKLFHIILSDLDHIYSRNKKDPFQQFLSEFRQWTKTDKKIGLQMQQTTQNIGRVLSFESDEMIDKLLNEVRTFLHLTVDP